MRSEKINIDQIKNLKYFINNWDFVPDVEYDINYVGSGIQWIVKSAINEGLPTSSIYYKEGKTGVFSPGDNSFTVISPDPDLTFDRYDIIAYDISKNQVILKEGVPSADPLPPDLLSDEVPIANIEIKTTGDYTIILNQTATNTVNVEEGDSPSYLNNKLGVFNNNGNNTTEFLEKEIVDIPGGKKINLNYDASKLPFVSFFETTVGDSLVGGEDGAYQTLKSAVDLGFKRILVVGHTTESVGISLLSGTFIYILEGNEINLAENTEITVTGGGGVTIIGKDRTSKIVGNITNSTGLVGGVLNLPIESNIQNITIDNSATTVAHAALRISGVGIYKNIKIVAPNINAGAILHLDNIAMYDIEIEGGGTSCYNVFNSSGVDGSGLTKVFNLILSGTFHATQNVLSGSETNFEGLFIKTTSPFRAVIYEASNIKSFSGAGYMTIYTLYSYIKDSEFTGEINCFQPDCLIENVVLSASIAEVRQNTEIINCRLGGSITVNGAYDMIKIKNNYITGDITFSVADNFDIEGNTVNSITINTGADNGIIKNNFYDVSLTDSGTGNIVSDNVNF